MHAARLTTRQLELIAGDTSIFYVDINDHTTLSEQMQASVPANWPPEHYDRQVLHYAAWYLAHNPDAIGWLLWYIILRDPQTRERVLIGTCGFDGKPSSVGSVTLGYAVLSQFQGRGYASEAVGALIDWAFFHHPVLRVAAETYPQQRASIRVMEKNGLGYVGPGGDSGVVRYELTRSDYEARGRNGEGMRGREPAGT